MTEPLEIAKEKEIKCRIKSKAYSIWLTALAPANLVLVVGGALLSLVAGSSLLIEQGLITKAEAGVMALASAGFAIIHKSLNCDHHQAECKKLKNFFSSMAESYDDLRLIEDEGKLKDKLEELNTEYNHILKNKTADPLNLAVRMAEKHYA